VLCPRGRFSSQLGVDRCAVCEAGSYNEDDGLTGCILCAQGSFARNQSSSGCSSCAIGSFANSTGASGCTLCPPGEASSEALFPTGCRRCEPGTYTPSAGASVCLLCPAGTYSSVFRASSLSMCLGCPPGKYSDAKGMTSISGCMDCPEGTSSMSGATDCLGCPPGTFPDKISGGCASCPKNSRSVENATSASACMCGEGLYKAYNAKAHGGVLTYRDDELGRKYAVHTFAVWGQQFTVMKPVMLAMTCANGGVWPSTFLDADTYYINSEGMESCELPLSIQYTVDVAPDPTETTTYFQCRQCQAGTFSDMAGVDQCNMCWEGTYQDQLGATQCQNCPAGTVAGRGMTQCTACPMHTYQDNNQCLACAAGKFTITTGSTSCVGCPPDTWSDGGTNGCRQCPPWSRSSGGTGPTGCLCYEGLFLDISSFEGDGGSFMGCMQCPAGSFSGKNSNMCTLCPSGTYGDRDAMGACIPCPAGQVSLPGSTGCSPCVLPQIPTSDGRACQDCPKGMVCQEDGEVITCPSGTYGPFTGATSLDQCLTCPPNQVCSEPSVAESCPPNTHSKPGSTSMLQCECDFGFECMYTKSLRGKVVLPVEPESFDGDMRQSFVQAIADAAGVSPDRVRIISIERAAGTSMRAIGGRVGPHTEQRTQVMIRVMGVTSLKGVRNVLQKHGFPRAVVKTRVSLDHHVEARRRPSREGGYVGGWI